MFTNTTVVATAASFVWFRDHRLGPSLGAGKSGLLYLTPEQASVLALIDGTTSIEGIAAALDSPVSSVIRTLEGVARSLPDALLSGSDPKRRRRLATVARALMQRTLALRDGDVGGDLDHYYRHVVNDATQTFEGGETTLSHLFRQPTDALSGRAYGGAFADALFRSVDERGAPPPHRWLEVGAGTGRMAQELLNRVRAMRPSDYDSTTYHILDLSQALIDAQRIALADHAPRVTWTVGNVRDLTWAAPFDCIIANEVIADLPVALVDPVRRLVLSGNIDLAALDRRFDLLAELRTRMPTDDAPLVYINTGAITWMERLREWLAPGGIAFLTEYGNTGEFPQPVLLKRHREFSIDFTTLEHVARRLGLCPSVQPVSSWLGFIGETPIVHRLAVDTIDRQIGPVLGLPHLGRTTYTLPQLRDTLGPLSEGLRGVTMTTVEDCEVMSPSRFHVLALRRPD